MNSDGTTGTISDPEDQLESLVNEAMQGAREIPAMRPALEARGTHHFALIIALVGLIALVAVIFNALLS